MERFVRVKVGLSSRCESMLGPIRNHSVEDRGSEPVTVRVNLLSTQRVQFTNEA